ncbi:MAG: hypothetical protein PHQ53_11025 [Candidatus Krumholzibacteria bacterium]|nr:hypothetical protein [Candidatus Krumholzibacteria bacterium]
MHVQWLLPLWAWPVMAAVAAACLIWARRAYRASQPLPPAAAQRALAGLRTAACLLVLVAIARPLMIQVRQVPEPALIAVVVEDSGSMDLPDQPVGPNRWLRSWQIASAVDSLVSRRARDAEVVFFRGNGRQPLGETTPAAARQEPPRAVGTDLSTLVAQTRQHLMGRPLRGLVAFSDGHSDAPPPRGTHLGAPLWLVGLGEVAGPADRFLADLRFPDRVQHGEPFVVEIAVGQLEAGDRALVEPVTVRLLHNAEVVAEETAPAAELIRFELTWTPDAPGLAILTVEVNPLDNERFLANNRATLAVDVQKDRARLLLLAAVPGWDVRFLAQAALLEPRLSLAVVRPGPQGPVLADSLQTWSAPLNAAAWLARCEGVVLAGPPADLLPDGGTALAAAVRQGLGLLAIAADPAADEQPRAWPAALQAVLPVSVGVQHSAGELPVRIAAGAPRHPILSGIAGGATAGANLEGWPPLRRVQVASLQSGAELLLVAGREQPLLVVAKPEAGRSLWFGGRRLWELAFWRLPERSLPTAAPGAVPMLRQMLLWTALGDQAAGISLLGQRLVFEEGEPIPLAVRWSDLRGDPVTGRQLAVEVATPENDQVRRWVLEPDPRRPGVAAGELPPLPPGRWRLTPQSTGPHVETGPSREIVVTPGQREQAQVRQDWRGLRQIAARLGGTALDAGRTDQLERWFAELTALDLAPATSQRQARWEPAAGWPWLLAVVALLAGEWLLRRRYGLL